MTTTIYSKNATQSAIQVNGVDAVVIDATGIILGASKATVGGGTDSLFLENDILVTTSYTIGQGALVSGAAVSIASPAVVSIPNTFSADHPVRFTTTGVLPTGLTTGNAYFVMAAGLSSSSFQVSATQGGAAVNTSGTQSGIHSVGKIKNASITGPLSVASNASVAVPSGARLVIL